MNKNWMKMLCALVAVLMLTGCRSGGKETTAPTTELPTTEPAVTEPNGVEEWDDPVDTVPAETTAPDETTLPAETVDLGEEPVDDPTTPTEAPDVTTEPVTTQPAVPTEPQQTTPPHSGDGDPADVTYEEYLSMTPAEQQAHYEQFPSLEAYIAWHNAALAEYEDSQSSIEVTGSVDIGDYITP